MFEVNIYTHYLYNHQISEKYGTGGQKLYSCPEKSANYTPDAHPKLKTESEFKKLLKLNSHMIDHLNNLLVLGGVLQWKMTL